jgi:type IV secretory pathway TrbD component
MDLNTTPAMAAPPGEVTNFHPEITEIQMKFITVYAGTLAGATVCLALRIWTRARIVRGIWVDDCKQIQTKKEERSLTFTVDAIIGAWLMDIGFFMSCVVWMKYGFGDHLWNISLAQLVKYAEVSERPYIASSLINTFISDSNTSRYFLLLGSDAHQVFHTLAVTLSPFLFPFEPILTSPGIFVSIRKSGSDGRLDSSCLLSLPIQSQQQLSLVLVANLLIPRRPNVSTTSRSLRQC